MRSRVIATGFLLVAVYLTSVPLASRATPRLDVHDDEITFSGSGCSEDGTDGAQASYADGKISAQYGAKYRVTLDRNARLSQKYCFLIIPIHVQAGSAVTVTKVSFRGRMDANPETRARLIRGSYVLGHDEPQFSTYDIATNDAQESSSRPWSHTETINMRIASECDATLDVVLNTTLALASASTHAPASATLESSEMDIQAAEAPDAAKSNEDAAEKWVRIVEPCT